MALAKLTKNLNHIQGLSDRPNTADGLTASKLKEKFDQAGNDIKDFLNETLIPEIDNNFENNTISKDDPSLTDSRKCNNEFDNYLVALENLHIKRGTSLPSTAQEDDVFLLY